MNTLGRYEIREEIGQGAMGVVYLGNDPTINRTVALKCLHLHLLEGDEGIGRRFQQEMRALGRLIHPNIVPIFDAGKDPSSGRAFIVMEYVKGISLEDLIKEKRDLSIDEVVQIGIKICRGLHFAHSKSVIHRDIKPGNILLSNDLEDVKITDFGIARLDNTSLTKTGGLTGTPRYMSPEQYRGDTLDGRSDLFAVGAILYELLTRQGPFQGNSLPTLMHQVIHHLPEPPSIVSKNISGPISDVVMRALEKEPELRFTSGKEMAEALITATEETKSSLLSDEGELTQLAMPMDALSDKPGTSAKKQPWSRYALFFSALLIVASGLFFILRETPPEIPDPIKIEPEARSGEMAQLEKEKRAQEKARIEQETIEQEQMARIEQEKEKFAQEKALAEQERLKLKELTRIEQEKITATTEKRAEEKALSEQARLEQLELDRIEQEKATSEREKLAMEIALMKQERLKQAEMSRMEQKRIQQKKDKDEKESLEREKRAEEKALVEQKRLKQLELARIEEEKVKAEEKREQIELQVEKKKQAEEKTMAEQEKLKQLELARIERKKVKAEEKKREEERLQAEKKKRAEEKELAEQERLKRKRQQEKIEFTRRKTSPPVSDDNKKLGEILDRLKTAYEKKDLEGLKGMSQIPTKRVLFLEQLFEDYETIHVAIKDLSIVGHSAYALISFTKLTSRKQNPVLPSNRWEDALLTLHKKDGKWGKMIW